MTTCSSCGSQVDEASSLCGRCGEPLEVSTATATALAPEALPAASSARPSSRSQPSSAISVSAGRFAAGELLGARYRIVGLLGQGGMGEVYRADDLMLDQPVALKFLPEDRVADPARRERFVGEVRVARQVAHPNVCRVYDIGEVDGHQFLSMELVRGDDLVTLLRQVGRFPEEKALEIARQICAGLAAAHDRGIVHRDLKPANVMIDAEGRVRITDFGLASLVGTVEAHDIRSGTPTYMAPEQLAGREVTFRSDIYALGLVLYELFTGKRALEAASMVELQRLQESRPTSPSSHVRDLDPAIEQIILRCLAPDPKNRPASALAVAAALPGGDPLAAALAAGETPSPEMVAASGAEGKLAPKTAGLLAGGALLLLLLAAFAASFNNAATIVGFDKPPVFLRERAKEMVEELAFDVPVADEASAIWTDFAYLRDRVASDESADRWADLKEGRHSNVYVWFRRSPRDLLAYPGFSVVDPADPPLQHSGEAIAWVDLEGRLVRFESMPPQYREEGLEGERESGADWTRLFELAGLDPSRFEEVEPAWTPPMSSDLRIAWEGPHPGLPETRLRIEGASFRGRPVYFRIIAPWTRPERMEVPEQTLAQRLSQVGGLVVLLLVLAVGVVLARRNLRLGRGDQSGAFKLAFWFLMAHTLVWLVWSHHVGDPTAQWQLIQLDIGYNLFLTVMIWVFYVALEPYVRRRWPDTLVSWSRLLKGHFRDPLIGRDVLVGAFGGAFVTNLFVLGTTLPIWLGWPPPIPNYPNWPERGFPEILGSLLDVPVHALLTVMQVLLLLLVVGVVVRKRWIAVLVCTAIFCVLSVGGTANLWIDLPLSAVGIGLFFYLLGWHGLLATAVALTLLNGLGGPPLSLDFGAWYQGYPLAALLAVVGLLAFAYRTSTEGEPFLKDEMLEGRS